MDQTIDIKNLRCCTETSGQSRAEGNTPFGALLADKDGNVLLEQSDVEITESRCTGHAETQVAKRTSQLYSEDCLKDCTFYTTAEPYAMYARAICWAGIGQVVYGMTEENLLAQTGSDPQNPTFDLPCREVFAKGQKKTGVVGPFPELVEEVTEVHKGCWDS